MMTSSHRASRYQPLIEYLFASVAAGEIPLTFAAIAAIIGGPLPLLG